MANSRREPQDEIQNRVSVLETFLEDLKAFYNAQTEAQEDALRSKINRSTRAVREIVHEAECMKAFTVAPPPAVGGFVQRNIDPFTTLFQDFYGHSFIPSVLDMIEETLGVVQSPGYLERIAAAKSDEETVDGLQRVEHICRRFPRVARQLQSRHADRGTISIDDESWFQQDEPWPRLPGIALAWQARRDRSVPGL